MKQDGPKAEKRVRQVIRRMALEAIGVEKEPDTPGEEMNWGGRTEGDTPVEGELQDMPKPWENKQLVLLV